MISLCPSSKTCVNTLLYSYLRYYLGASGNDQYLVPDTFFNAQVIHKFHIPVMNFIMAYNCRHQYCIGIEFNRRINKFFTGNRCPQIVALYSILLYSSMLYVNYFPQTYRMLIFSNRSRYNPYGGLFNGFSYFIICKNFKLFWNIQGI